MMHDLVTPVASQAGVSFRPLHGVEDAEAICAVRAGCAARDQIDPLSTLEGAPRLERARAAIAKAMADGQQDRWQFAITAETVAGYCRIETWREDDGTNVYLNLGWVLPAWRGKGIGTALLHWAEERSRAAAEADGLPQEMCEYAANASATETDAAALLLHEGYHAGYTVVDMDLPSTAALPMPGPLPAGIEVRPVAPDHYLPISESVIDSYKNEYPGGRFGEVIEARDYATSLAEAPNEPALWQVAWAGEQVAGQVMTVIREGRAEVFEVSVRPAWRRRGLARALLLRALHELRGRTPSIIRLHTMWEFPTCAKDLYQSVGFRIVKRYPRYRKRFSGT